MNGTGSKTLSVFHGSSSVGIGGHTTCACANDAVQIQKQNTTNGIATRCTRVAPLPLALKTSTLEHQVTDRTVAPVTDLLGTG